MIGAKASPHADADTASMTIPPEPIESIPRPMELIETVAAGGEDAKLDQLYDEAIRDEIERFEATRETAFAKIRARVMGTELASAALGVS
jgi:hypothetical protein